MNDDDDKADARGEIEPRSDRLRRGGSPQQDQFPVRNTAPAGTPVHKLPAALPLGAPIAPEQLGPPPVVKSTSDRPPDAETMTQARTVGGQTARLKVPGSDDEVPRTRGRRVPPPPQRHAEDEPPPSGRNGDRPAPRSARGAALRREPPAAFETEVKFSEPDLPAAKAKGAETADPSESRWPFAIALGAVAFAIGSLLPLPFRKYIVGVAPEAAQSAPATIPLPSLVQSAAAAPPGMNTAGARTAAPPPAAAASSASAATSADMARVFTSATPTAATAAPAAPSGATSAWKRPAGVKGGKGGPIGDIF